MLTILLLGALAVSAAVPTVRDLDLVVPGGVILKASIREPANPTGGIVLFNSCNSQGRKQWDPLADALATSGIAVLTLNYRGVDGSGGEPFRSTSLPANLAYWEDRWLPDADAALEALRRTVGSRPIAVGGASCGVALAVLLAERHPHLAALVALSGPYPDRGASIVAGRPAMPVFAAASAEDGPAPKWLRDLTAASKHPRTRMLDFTGAGHATAMLTSRPDLVTSITAFLADALASRGEVASAAAARTRVVEMYEALSARDADRFLSFFDRGRFTEIENGITHDWATHERIARSFISRAESLRVTWQEPPHVTLLSPDAAVAHGVDLWTTNLRGTPSQSTWRSSYVLARSSEGIWQIVHMHRTKLSEPTR
jgi:dienelactone hydrolase